MEIKELCQQAYDNSCQKGFWDRERNILDPDMAIAYKMQRIMLIITELSEAVEGLRKNDIENFEEEIADVFIRLGDLCGGYNIDIEKAIKAKIEKNKNRNKMHNKNC